MPHQGAPEAIKTRLSSTAVAAAAICALAVMLFGGPAQAGVFRRRFSETIRGTAPWSATQTVFISETGGSIHIEGDKRDDINIKAIRTCFAPELATAKKHAKEIRMNMDMRNDALNISTSLPSAWFPDVSGHIDYFLTTPATSQFVAGTITGDISVFNIKGKTDVSTVSGDIEIGASSGPVSAKTVTGDILSTRSSGLTSLQSTTGAISLRIEELNSSKLEISTITGPVKIKIAAKSNITLNVKTVFGRIESKPPKKAEVITETPHSVTIKAGDGEHIVNISTVSGNIVIEGYGDDTRGKWPPPPGER